MHGRVYTVAFSASVSAIQDLFEFVPATAKPIRLRRVRIEQSESEVSEQLRLEITRGHTTSGSGGTSPTPSPNVSTDTAAGFTAEVNNTTQATAGSPVNLGFFGFNVLNGFDLAYAPEEAPAAVNGERLVIELPVAPGAALTMQGTAWIEELA